MIVPNAEPRAGCCWTKRRLAVCSLSTKHRQRREVRRSKEYRRLKSVVPSVARQNTVSKVRNVTQRHATSRNVTQRHATSRNVTQRRATSRNVAQRRATSRNVAQRRATSRNVAQRRATSRNVTLHYSSRGPISYKSQVFTASAVSLPSNYD